MLEIEHQKFLKLAIINISKFHKLSAQYSQLLFQINFLTKAFVIQKLIQHFGIKLISFKSHITQMRNILLALVFVVVVLGQVNNKVDEKDVIVLDNKSFETAIYGSQNDSWIIDFYAPWCGHCVKMVDEWAKLATNLKGFVKVAKIDASKYPQFNDMYGLKGFPHIVFIPAGFKSKQTYYVHSGPRTADAFQFWILQKISQHRRSILQKLTNERKWNQVCIGSHSDFCVVFFLPKLLQSSSADNTHDDNNERIFYLKTITGLMKKFTRQPVSFLWTQAGDHIALEQQFRLGEQFPSVVLVNSRNKRFSVMNRSFTEDDFEQWLGNILDIQFEEIEGEFAFGPEIRDWEDLRNGEL